MQQTALTSQLTYLIIYNEQSGVGYLNHKKIIQRFFEKQKISITIHNTTPDGSFLDIDPNLFERIIAVGGDGTVRAVANWMLQKNSSTPLAIIPTGSANVLAQTLGIPFNTEKALELAVSGNPQKIDVGIINNAHYFLLAAGMGLDAHIMRHTPRKLKKIFGVLAYGQGLIRTFLNLRVDRFFVKSDEYESSLKAQSIFVSNIDKFLSFKLHPNAKFNDGVLNVAILGQINVWQAIKIAWRLLQGLDVRDARYKYFQTKHIYIQPTSKRKVPMQIDGEVVNLPYMDIRMAPQRFAIISKKKLS